MIALKVLLFSKIQHLTLTKCCVIFKFSTLQSVYFKATQSSVAAYGKFQTFWTYQLCRWDYFWMHRIVHWRNETFVFRTRLSLLIIIISHTGFHLIHGTLIGDRKQLPIFCQSDRLISCKSECIPALWLVYGWKYWVPMLEGHKHLFFQQR